MQRQEPAKKQIVQKWVIRQEKSAKQSTKRWQKIKQASDCTHNAKKLKRKQGNRQIITQDRCADTMKTINLQQEKNMQHWFVHFKDKNNSSSIAKKMQYQNILNWTI